MCFGVFPAVILYFSGDNNIFGVAILVFYVLCAVIRLAFFNVLETKRQKSEDGCAKGYRGLPVTAAAIIFPFFYIVGLFVPSIVMNVIYYIDKMGDKNHTTILIEEKAVDKIYSFMVKFSTKQVQRKFTSA